MKHWIVRKEEECQRVTRGEVRSQSRPSNWGHTIQLGHS